MPRVAKGNLASAFIFAWEGIAYVVHTQRNMRIHLGVATVVLLTAGALRVSRIELAILLLCIMAVTALEMLNTVVEAAVDLATEEYDARAKVAKDVAAGAVLATSVGAALIGVLILGPHLLRVLPLSRI